jgi:hypothetical protein
MLDLITLIAHGGISLDLDRRRRRLLRTVPTTLLDVLVFKM